MLPFAMDELIWVLPPVYLSRVSQPIEMTIIQRGAQSKKMKWINESAIASTGLE